MTVPARVLVIEDNPVYLKLMELYFKKNAFDCHLYSDAESAEIWASKNQFDWVFSDYNLPGKNGYQLLKKLYPKKGCKGKFVMITANENVKKECRGLNKVVDQLLYKPVSSKSLDKILKDS